MSNIISNDPFGEAVSDYFTNPSQALDIVVDSTITEGESISPSYFFRDFEVMPPLEKAALNQVHGKVLDVGACAGAHTLYLQANGIDVKAIDISIKCCETMRNRGVKSVECIDYFQLQENIKYDTILFMMNGIGIAGNLEGARMLLEKAKYLLNPNGKILFDSSDIEYMYYEEDGSKWIDLNSEYYGELHYDIAYKKQSAASFNWLFIDPEKMNELARLSGYTFTLLQEGEHYDYLGELKKNP